MKVLLDECIPRRFKRSLGGHECRTVPEVGLAGKKNGELLTLAEAAGFEVFLTIDRGIEHEQNLRSRSIAIVLIRAKSSRLSDLQPIVSDVLRVLDSIHPGELVRVGG
jgi:predicted nuclease of predicted toxin-antitoxin system